MSKAAPAGRPVAEPDAVGGARIRDQVVVTGGSASGGLAGRCYRPP